MCGFLAYQGPVSKELMASFELGFQTLTHRGPDDHQIKTYQNAILGFHRLSIMGLHPSGNQPFEADSLSVMCNGEIYNYKSLKTLFTHYPFKSESDCEVLIPLLQSYTLDQVVELLDGEYAFIAHDQAKGQTVAARDPMGIRPLFWGRDKNSNLCFASEMKALLPLCEEITPFPPGHYWDGESLKPFLKLSETPIIKGELHEYWDTTLKTQQPKMKDLLTPIRELLIEATKKRLQSHAPLGALLSGGLDSSLVCSIAMKELKGRAPLRTFAVGMDKDPIDLRYAREVADFIGSDHQEIIITTQDLEEALEKVVWHLETWDITTIRASLGMYLLCKKIKETTDIKVLLTGEVSDELFGYKYTDFAPSGDEFQKEARKRIHELYLYDVLRADRCISGASLEARVPFSDTAFVQYVMSIDPELKRNHYMMGKYLLREAFREGDYLPERLLNREKAAFSDAVGHSLVDFLKERAAKMYEPKDLIAAQEKYPHGTPFTLESLMYREIFEKFYPGRAKVLPDFWMPNKTWENCNVDDPSARVLPNYGLSGR